MSYEKKVQEDYKDGKELPEKTDFSMVKYFWQASPLSGMGKDTVPKFLRNIEVLKSFTENELRIFSRYLHTRDFSNKAVIFKQYDVGFGFYFIYSGHVDVIVEGGVVDAPEDREIQGAEHVLSLEKGDYFGELALLQDNNLRSATVMAKGSCTLLGIFKPDLEELIEEHPVIATKLLQAVSVILANRLFSLTNEIRGLKYKLQQLEKQHERP